METKRIVITGGPGTGKTSVIQLLEEKGYSCLPEVSREVIRSAQKEGIDQLFLKKPLLFSQLLLEGRIEQFKQAEQAKSEYLFFDRGIPDVVAYLDFAGTEYPSLFREVCHTYTYADVFFLPPWEEIYTCDPERYESFEQACLIHNHLMETYSRSGYQIKEVPCSSLEDRVSFILEHLP